MSYTPKMHLTCACISPAGPRDPQNTQHSKPYGQGHVEHVQLDGAESSQAAELLQALLLIGCDNVSRDIRYQHGIAAEHLALAKATVVHPAPVRLRYGAAGLLHNDGRCHDVPGPPVAVLEVRIEHAARHIAHICCRRAEVSQPAHATAHELGQPRERDLREVLASRGADVVDNESLGDVRGAGNADGPAVATRAAADARLVELVLDGVVHDAEHRPALVQQPNADAYERDAMHKVGGAVERIHDPRRLRPDLFELGGPIRREGALLTHKLVVRRRLVERRKDHLLRGLVRGRDEVHAALAFDAQAL
mmetsp:Transcript_14060/g.42031  ORF Transcript_14060/g.42031 Transcript_14060/m.42031 type:complete len:307 (+) Transcript_14060:1251-2171(+)